MKYNIFKNSNTPSIRRSLGAELNINDNRDIHIASVSVPVFTPSKCITDISMLPVEDQMQNGSCVGQGEGKGEEYREYKEKGVFTRLSKRFIYSQCKILDGVETQGTSPRYAAKVLTDKGTPSEALVPDNNTLPYFQYCQVNVTNDILTDASGKRVAGYAFAYSLRDIKQVIVQQGVLHITVMVGDWENGVPLKPTHQRGLHRVLCFGYEDAFRYGIIPDTKIYIRNSWGTTWGLGGDGWFWWSDYQEFMFDMIVYTDMPNTVIDAAKSTRYQFTRLLKLGMTGSDVRELQKRLFTEKASDGSPCFRYPNTTSPVYTTYFGQFTVEAVQRYQSANHLVSSGTPSTTGYGQLGPKTINSLNSLQQQTGMIDKWADAIQLYEGYTPGSRSYRNNNPGNLRFVGQQGATEDRVGIPVGQSGFCIFSSYNAGRTALVTMLTNACTGKSAVYQPTMTLLAFYEKYAPSSDNNYPTQYAMFVANKLGVWITTQISTLA